MSAWSHVRNVAEQIMTLCMSNYLGGTERAYLEEDPFFYYVGIGPPDFHPWGIEVPLRNQGRAMDDVDFVSQHHLSWTPIYFV